MTDVDDTRAVASRLAAELHTVTAERDEARRNLAEAIRLACLGYAEIDDHGHPLCAVAIAEQLVPLMRPDADTPNSERLREIIRGHLETLGEAYASETCDCDEDANDDLNPEED